MNLFAGDPDYKEPPVADDGICQWQTCNELTDYEVVKCDQPATHREWANIFYGINRILCLAHANHVRTITERSPTKL